MKAMGRNTADSTMTMPTRAEVISSMLFCVASTGPRPSSSITRSTFSTTTMASSTSRPMASTSANMVSVLMEKPATASTPKVPSSTTGMAITGMIVARQLCRKARITRKTSTTASARV